MFILPDNLLDMKLRHKIHLELVYLNNLSPKKLQNHNFTKDRVITPSTLNDSTAREDILDCTGYG